MSSTDISDVETAETVEGFQFEPIRKKQQQQTDDGWTTYDEEEEDSEDISQLFRKNLGVGSWCKCSFCFEMPTEKERVCCHELDFTSYINIEGNRNKKN